MEGCRKKQNSPDKYCWDEHKYRTPDRKYCYNHPACSASYYCWGLQNSGNDESDECKSQVITNVRKDLVDAAIPRTPKDADECLKAAEQNGFSYHGTVDSEMYPKNCYLWPGDNKVRWNSNAKGYSCGEEKLPENVYQCKGAALAAGKSYHGDVATTVFKPNCFVWSGDDKVRYNASRDACVGNLCGNSTQLKIPKEASCVLYTEKPNYEYQVNAAVESAREKMKEMDLENIDTAQCNKCNDLMKIIEPTVIALYKIFIEKDPDGIIKSLAPSLVQGMTITDFELRVIPQLTNNELLIKSIADIGGDEDKLSDYIKYGVDQGIICLAKAAGTAIKGELKGSSQNFAVKLMHSFFRCAIKAMSRKIVMEKTNCNNDEACKPSVTYFKAIEKKFKEVVNLANNKINLIKNVKKSDIKRGKKIVEDGINNVVKKFKR